IARLPASDRTMSFLRPAVAPKRARPRYPCAAGPAMSSDVAASEPPQLPKLDDFSPEIVGGRLKPLLQIVQSHAGNAAQIEEEIGKLGTLQLAPGATRTASQRTRLYNVRLSLSHVGLTDAATKTQLTDFGRRLLAIATDAEA